MEKLINQLNQEISETDLADFAKRVRKLTDKQIDELWFRCGFIIEKYKRGSVIRDREPKYKAIYQHLIDDIHKSLKEAKLTCWHCLLYESDINECKENLTKLEKQIKGNIPV